MLSIIQADMQFEVQTDKNARLRLVGCQNMLSTFQLLLTLNKRSRSDLPSFRLSFSCFRVKWSQTNFDSTLPFRQSFSSSTLCVPLLQLIQKAGDKEMKCLFSFVSFAVGHLKVHYWVVLGWGGGWSNSKPENKNAKQELQTPKGNSVT